MSNDRGFMLIDTLMELVAIGGLFSMISIAGIQMVIAMTAITGARDEARFDAMRRDLENLRARQAIYYADELSYSSSPKELRFSGSPGVTVHIVASDDGWAATAAHVGHHEGQQCSLYLGHVSPGISSTMLGRPGEIACTGVETPYL